MKKLTIDLNLSFSVDADAVTWSGWLRALIQPLIENETIGASSGNRWYTPENGELGSLVRAFWNMGFGHPDGPVPFSMGGEFGDSDRHRQERRKCFNNGEPRFRPMRQFFNVVKRAGKKILF